MVFKTKKIIVSLAIFLTAVFLCSCSSGTKTAADKTAVELTKEGTIHQTIVEDNTDSISQDDLTLYINEQIHAYTAEAGENAVELKNCKADSSKISIEIEYASIGDYASFNKVPAYEGDLLSAVSEGYTFGSGFKTDSGLAYSGYTLPVEYPELQVLVLQEPVNVILPNSALLISDNVSKNDDGSYTISGSDVTGIPEIFNTINQEPSYLIFRTATK